MPRLRWVGITATLETPATGRALPGTFMSTTNESVVPTIRPSSKTPSVLSRTIRASEDSNPPSSWCPPKPAALASIHSLISASLIGRTSVLTVRKSPVGEGRRVTVGHHTTADHPRPSFRRTPESIPLCLGQTCNLPISSSRRTPESIAFFYGGFQRARPLAGAWGNPQKNTMGGRVGTRTLLGGDGRPEHRRSSP